MIGTLGFPRRTERRGLLSAAAAIPLHAALLVVKTLAFVAQPSLALLLVIVAGIALAFAQALVVLAHLGVAGPARLLRRPGSEPRLIGGTLLALAAGTVFAAPLAGTAAVSHGLVDAILLAAIVVGEFSIAVTGTITAIRRRYARLLPVRLASAGGALLLLPVMQSALLAAITPAVQAGPVVGIAAGIAAGSIGAGLLVRARRSEPSTVARLAPVLQPQ